MTSARTPIHPHTRAHTRAHTHAHTLSLSSPVSPEDALESKERDAVAHSCTHSCTHTLSSPVSPEDALEPKERGAIVKKGTIKAQIASLEAGTTGGVTSAVTWPTNTGWAMAAGTTGGVTSCVTAGGMTSSVTKLPEPAKLAQKDIVTPKGSKTSTPPMKTSIK